jgi:hypothetical protein
MKATYFFIVILAVLIVVMIYTRTAKEGFLNNYCAKFTSCSDCASASGCSWCPKAKQCLTSTTLKSTDNECNQMNTIQSSFRCQSTDVPPSLPDAIASNDVMYEFSLYKNRITDKIPPPNLYMAGDIKVSNEDLLSNMNDVRNDISNYKTEMPGIIASTVEQQMKPMVKGILSENYYIQGFEDMNAETKCKTYNSCSSCLDNNECAWNPRSNSCEKKGVNNMWQVTQPSRCVLTSSTINRMVINPAGNV